MLNKPTIVLENTNFPKWENATNFSGNPARDSFGDTRRKANILIPDPEQAKELLKAGYNVRQTKPHADEDPSQFQPEYFLVGLLKYRDKNGVPVKYPPRVYLVTDDGETVLLDEETVGTLDKTRVKNVNVVINPYVYDPINNKMSLYIRTMYVEQGIDDDPFAARYRARRANMQPDPDDDPFIE